MKKALILCVIAFLVASAFPVVAQDRSSPLLPTTALHSDRNSDAMVTAARALQFIIPGNRAQILEKTDPSPADVAVVFGYADNRVACEDLARVLTAAGRVGSFRCYPVR